MFSRLSQLARHLSRPLPNYTHLAATARSRTGLVYPPTRSIMAEERSKAMIHTAGCIIIGDEVLGGKTVDTNSAYFAKFCFAMGIELKRIEVIADDENEISETTRRMSNNYDMVVTSGGIGPTHDDITYESIAKAFEIPLIEHTETLERMKKLSKTNKKQPDFDWNVPSAALTAKKRMVILPIDEKRPMEDQVIFVKDDLWVPISVVNGNVHILPGVPRLFESLLDGLKPRLVSRLAAPEGKGIHRLLFSTPLSESAMAEYLTKLSGRVGSKGIKVGSYPTWGKSRNTVTLVGRDLELMESLISEVEQALEGRRVMVEGEDDSDDNPEAG